MDGGPLCYLVSCQAAWIGSASASKRRACDGVSRPQRCIPTPCQDAHKIIFRVAELVAECREHAVHYCIENPDSSRFWLTRPMLKIAADSFVVQMDFCQYGERWRKRTRLVTSCPALQQMERLCSSSGTYPNCSRTGKRRIQLSGIDARTGAFKTMLACPCPKPMVRRAASLLANLFLVGNG